jgi:hypothetical protein
VALPLRGALPLLERPLLRVPDWLAGFAPLAWPVRWPHAGAEAFAVRAPDAPLAGRLPFPLPLVGRVPLAVCVPAGRDSELERRAGRLLNDDCAGLRSREWVAGRLK